MDVRSDVDGDITSQGRRPIRRLTDSVAAWLVVCACAGPSGLHAQTLLGRVLDEVNETPVGGAVVTLVTRDGDERLRTLTDSAGRFTLTPPEAGEYLLVAESFGYIETRSPLLALGVDGQAPIDLLITPAPIGVEGLEVSVEEEATEELRAFGLSPAQLGNRWIDHGQIQAITVKRDMGSIIERTSVPGTRIIRPENMTPGGDLGLCVSLTRARQATGAGTCAMVVLNGIPISPTHALNIDPETIESMAVLNPTEATTYYGTVGGMGAVLVWTTRGR